MARLSEILPAPERITKEPLPDGITRKDLEGIYEEELVNREFLRKLRDETPGEQKNQSILFSCPYRSESSLDKPVGAGLENRSYCDLVELESETSLRGDGDSTYQNQINQVVASSDNKSGICRDEPGGGIPPEKIDPVPSKKEYGGDNKIAEEVIKQLNDQFFGRPFLYVFNRPTVTNQTGGYTGNHIKEYLTVPEGLSPNRRPGTGGQKEVNDRIVNMISTMSSILQKKTKDTESDADSIGAKVIKQMAFSAGTSHPNNKFHADVASDYTSNLREETGSINAPPQFRGQSFSFAVARRRLALRRVQALTKLMLANFPQDTFQKTRAELLKTDEAITKAFELTSPSAFPNKLFKYAVETADGETWTTNEKLADDKEAVQKVSFRYVEESSILPTTESQQVFVRLLDLKETV